MALIDRRPAAEPLRYPDALQDWDELRAVAPLAGSDQQGQRAKAALSGEVDLGGQAAAGACEALLIGPNVWPGHAVPYWQQSTRGLQPGS